MDFSEATADPEELLFLERRLGRCRPHLLVAPPRSCSTALGQALRQHSRLDHYVHEPCGRFSYQKTPVSSILDALGSLTPDSLIKEMSFQFREPEVMQCFLEQAREPVLFLVREPLLTLESRVRMVLGDLARAESTPDAERRRIQEAVESTDYSGVDDLLDDDAFPMARTGWHDLGEQLDYCRQAGVPFTVVDGEAFRAEPEPTLRAICQRWGLAFEPAMLRWGRPVGTPEGALARHRAWYGRVAESTGVLPPEEVPFTAEQLPPRFREHLAFAETIYRRALEEAAHGS